MRKSPQNPLQNLFWECQIFTTHTRATSTRRLDVAFSVSRSSSPPSKMVSTSTTFFFSIFENVFWPSKLCWSLGEESVKGSAHTHSHTFYCPRFCYCSSIPCGDEKKERKKGRKHPHPNKAHHHHHYHHSRSVDRVEERYCKNIS